MRLEVLNSQEWALFSKDMHTDVFNDPHYWSIERIDFAILVIENEIPVGFATVRILDEVSVYLQYGGALTKNKFFNFSGYQLVINFLKERYFNITTYIENENTTMLKFAMKAGFRIMGIRTFKNKIYLEHYTKGLE